MDREVFRRIALRFLVMCRPCQQLYPSHVATQCRLPQQSFYSPNLHETLICPKYFRKLQDSLLVLRRIVSFLSTAP